VLFVRTLRRWDFVMSSPLFISGRRLCFVNPLTSALAQFRIRWAESDTRRAEAAIAPVQEFVAAMRPLQYLVAVVLILWLALPVELYLFGTGLELLVLMASFYALILVALAYIYVRRGVLQVCGRSFAAMSFDALACAPFSVNLVRKLAMQRSL